MSTLGRFLGGPANSAPPTSTPLSSNVNKGGSSFFGGASSGTARPLILRHSAARNNPGKSFCNTQNARRKFYTVLLLKYSPSSKSHITHLQTVCDVQLLDVPYRVQVLHLSILTRDLSEVSIFYACLSGQLSVFKCAVLLFYQQQTAVQEVPVIWHPREVVEEKVTAKTSQLSTAHMVEFLSFEGRQIKSVWKDMRCTLIPLTGC